MRASAPTNVKRCTEAWQYVRLFRHLLNRNYYQVWAGHVPQGRQPYYQRAKAEPSPERYRVLQAT